MTIKICLPSKLMIYKDKKITLVIKDIFQIIKDLMFFLLKL